MSLPCSPRATLVLLLTLVLAPKTALAQDIDIQSNFQPPALKFDLILKNPSNSTKRIVKIGVRSKVENNERCLGDSAHGLPPIANYTVKFFLVREETITDADPPIEMEPGATARFTISAVPELLGACGQWSAAISAITIFDSGEKVYSQPARITMADYQAYRRRATTDEDIVNALRNRDDSTRALAAQSLLRSSLSIDAKELLLEARLDDPSIRVRTAAARVAGDLRLRSLEGKIIALLNAAKTENETGPYCRALGGMQDPATIDIIIRVFTQSQAEETVEQCGGGLVNLSHPDVMRKLRPLFTTGKRWLTSRESADRRRYLSLCHIAIAYRDEASAPGIAEAMTKLKDDQFPRELLFLFYDLNKLNAGEGQFISTPLAIKLKPAVQSLMSHPNYEVRTQVLDFMGRLLLPREETESILSAGLGDSEPYIRLKAAQLAGEGGYAALAGRVRALITPTTDESDKKEICRQLYRLKAPCRDFTYLGKTASERRDRKIYQIIAEVLGTSVDALEEDDSFEKYDPDKAKISKLAERLAKEFGIPISKEDELGLESVMDVFNHLNRHVIEVPDTKLE